MKKFLALALAGASLLAASHASAQNYGTVEELYRYDLTVGAGAGAVNDKFGFDVLDDAETYLDPASLATHYPGTYNNAQPVTGWFDFRGLDVVGRYAAASPFFTFEIPAITGQEAQHLCDNATLGLPTTSPCTFRYAGTSRASSFAIFESDLDDFELDSPLAKAILAAMARKSPIDPLAGNPDSLQGSLVRGGLDLANDTDSAVELGSADAEPWMIGGTYSRISAGRLDSDRFDARLQRSFRPVEGSRAALKMNLPLNYSTTRGQVQYNASFSAGLEMPLVDNKWSLEPRVSYGITASDELASAGEIASFSVTSRYRIDGVGRGYIILGNMIGYTSTVSLIEDGHPGIANTVFRNGLAYEMPLKGQVGGRATSLRASYTYTNFTGDELYLDAFHEASISFGVRAREGEARIGAELFRVALVGTFGDDYSSAAVQVGFRF